ncbi:MAG: hypothetical protein ACI95X_003136 [Paraglaciecola sp.]|jgi:hypothetical protein
MTHIINTFNPTENFYCDIIEKSKEFHTVIYTCLEIAFYLGFKKVIIIGMNH